MLCVVPARADEAALQDDHRQIRHRQGISGDRGRRARARRDRRSRRSKRRLTALSEGNLSVRKSDAQVFIVKEAGASVSLFDPLSGEPAGEAAKAETHQDQGQQRAAPRHPRRAGHADARLARPGRAARRRRNHVPQSRSRRHSPRSMRRSPRRPTPSVKARLEQARASAVLVSDLAEADKLAAIDVLGARGDREALSLLTSFEASRRRRAEGRRDRGDRRHQQLAGRLVGRPEHLVRHLARLGAAAGGDRACHHLRRHGRHQHGAWRDGDARRLHDLRRAGGDPHSRARPVRLVAGDRAAAGLPGLGAGRAGHRARHHPLPLRPAAGDAARHLGRLADPAAGGAHHLRADQPRGRQPVLDVGLVRPRPVVDHLEPAVDPGLRARRSSPCCCS